MPLSGRSLVWGCHLVLAYSCAFTLEKSQVRWEGGVVGGGQFLLGHYEGSCKPPTPAGMWVFVTINSVHIATALSFRQSPRISIYFSPVSLPSSHTIIPRDHQTLGCYHFSPEQCLKSHCVTEKEQPEKGKPTELLAGLWALWRVSITLFGLVLDIASALRCGSCKLASETTQLYSCLCLASQGSRPCDFRVSRLGAAICWIESYIGPPTWIVSELDPGKNLRRSQLSFNLSSGFSYTLKWVDTHQRLNTNIELILTWLRRLLCI